MKFYTNDFIEYFYKGIYNYCWLLLITGLYLKLKSFATYRVTLYVEFLTIFGQLDTFTAL